jgi:hypothetical protein
MREMGILGPIWIDVLCINQNDIDKRNIQVGQMGSIYKGAARVVVWLGSQDEDTAPALTCLRRATSTVAGSLKDVSTLRLSYDRCNYTEKELVYIFSFIFQRR